MRAKRGQLLDDSVNIGYPFAIMNQQHYAQDIAEYTFFSAPQTDY